MQSISPFLLLLILQRVFLPAFAKMTPGAVVSTRCWRKPFSLLSTTGKCSKCQTPGQKNSPLTYYYNRQGSKWLEAEPDNKKAVNLFQDLLLSLAALVAAGIQFLWLVRRIVEPELELTVN